MAVRQHQIPWLLGGDEGKVGKEEGSGREELMLPGSLPRATTHDGELRDGELRDGVEETAPKNHTV